MCFKQVKAKNDIFVCDFILFLKNKIRGIFELEYMCSVFTFVQYILEISKPCFLPKGFYASEKQDFVFCPRDSMHLRNKINSCRPTECAYADWSQTLLLLINDLHVKGTISIVKGDNY